MSLLSSHKHYIRALESFKYVDPSTGRDDGANVRKKSEKIMELLNDRGRIEEARSAAAKTRNKFGGVGSDAPSTYGGYDANAAKINLAILLVSSCGFA